MSHLSPTDRPDSRVSLALSDRTYHSFHDIELYEPGGVSQPRPSKPTHQLPSSRISKGRESPKAQHHARHPVRQEMRRQDSGYESLSPRDSHSSCRQTSTAPVTPSPRPRRTKTTSQDSTKSGPVSRVPRSGRKSASPRRSQSRQTHQTQPQQPVTYFHFPHFVTSEPEFDEPGMALDDRNPQCYASGTGYSLTPESPTHSLPPPTTHYWTSDQTRRLEYAAIDAASRGVRGWVMRNIVPDCFVPTSKRRIGFEDDRGSVVRYRLELEADDGADQKKAGRGKRFRLRSWFFSMRRN